MAFQHLSIGAACAALILAASAGAALAAPGSTVRGEALVGRNCSMCHALEQPGDSPNAMAPPLRTLYRYISMRDLAQALRQGLLTKHPAMPVFRFTAAEIEDVMAYLRSIQEQAEPISHPARPARGQRSL
jgi:mono/diheme cytochrome c family protein